MELTPSIKTYKNLPWISAFFEDWDLLQLFFAPSENHPPLEEMLYLFMKRFKTQPSEFYSMDLEMRKFIFDREYDLVKMEAKEAKDIRNKTEEVNNKN